MLRRTQLKYLSQAVLVALAALPFVVGPSVAQTNSPSSKTVAVVSWGGSYQEAQRKAFFQPFEKATGIHVIEGVGPQIEKTRAAVQSGHPGFDLASTNQAFNLIGIDQNLWLPIDYGYFDKKDLAAIPAEFRQKYGVGTIVYDEGLAFSTKAFPAAGVQPNSWQDAWNVTKFPGKRAFPWCDVTTYPLPEAALLADGVPPQKLYEILSAAGGIDRALRKLKELAPHIVWWHDIAQAGQMLTSGDAVMSMAPSNRVQTLIDQGAPLQIVWNQNRYTFDVWYVLRGAPDADNAMRFIAFASRPEQQAEMAKLGGYGPTNPLALPLIDPSVARTLPTYPDHLKVAFQKNESWWRQNRQKWVEACTSALY